MIDAARPEAKMIVAQIQVIRCLDESKDHSSIENLLLAQCVART